MRKLLIGLLIFGVVSLSIIGIIFGVTNKDNTVVEPQIEYNDYDVRLRLMDVHTNELASTKYYHVELDASKHTGNFQKSKEIFYLHDVYYVWASFVDIN